MKIWLLLVLVLIVLSCDAKKKRKKKKNSKTTVSRWQGIIRGRKTTPKPTTQPPTTTTQPTVSQQAASNGIFDLAKSIDSVEKFYQVFKNVSRLPQHQRRKEQSTPEKVEFRHEMFCSPQESLVKLPSPRFGEGFIWPPCAILKRCQGCCRLSDYTTCQPTKVQMKPIYYYHITDPSLQMDPKIKSVEMEVHDACDCECIATRDSCNPNQFWNQGHCRCECNQKSQQLGCAKDLKFDEETCGCICNKAVEICDHRKKWDYRDCGCVCKNTCPDRTHTLNPETCDCVKL